MDKDIINKIKPELEKAIDYLKRGLSQLISGRASPALVEDIKVECFGKKFPLKQLAAISCPQPRQIVIQVWDESYIKPIEQALFSSSLGVKPVVEKKIIRISLPSPTQEDRKKMTKLVAEKAESAKETIRGLRKKTWKALQEEFRQGNISEDDKFRAKDELQDLIDEYNNKIEEMIDIKKKEIME